MFQRRRTFAGSFSTLVLVGSKVLIASEGRRPEPSQRRKKKGRRFDPLFIRFPCLKRRRMSRTKGEGQRGRDVAIDQESCCPSSPRRDPGYRKSTVGEEVQQGGGGRGEKEERGGRKERAPPSRPDRSKTSRLLFRRPSLPPFVSGEKCKKQEVEDTALTCPPDTVTP